MQCTPQPIRSPARAKPELVKIIDVVMKSYFGFLGGHDNLNL